MSAFKTMCLSVMVGALVLGAPAAGFAHGNGHAFGHAHLKKPKPSNESAANSNGSKSQDRDKGHARAEDRMSAQGLNHNNAGITDNDTPPGH